MSCFQQKTSGQLTLGLAFGFTMILALFAFVFNTTMNVREKIKLQQTSDYAALVASNAQRHYLNDIREANLAIEALWFTALAQQQVPHCVTSLVSSLYGFVSAPVPSPNTAYVSAEATINGYTAALNANLNLPSEEDITSQSLSATELSSLCANACGRYQSMVNQKIRSVYQQKRDYIESQIKKRLKDGNKMSFAFALYHFLQPENLPWGLQQKLKKTLNENFTMQDMIQAYEGEILSIESNNGEWGYNIVSENKDDPLFLPKSEIRPFPLLTHNVITNTDNSLNPVCTYGGPAGIGRPANAYAKVLKDGIYETHFFTGVNYMPPANMFEENEALTKRRLHPDEFGKVEGRLTDPSQFKRQMGMSVRSAAKPYGGSFPSSVLTDVTSMLTSLATSGSADTPSEFQEGAGKEFKGSKLFGIADEEEIGGFEIMRADIEAEVFNEQGNIQQVWKILRKDYLH